jgi:4-hydroxybenzoate polyprenyltransferase
MTGGVLALYHELIHVVAGAGLTLLFAHLLTFLGRTFRRASQPQGLLAVLVVAAIIAAAVGAAREVWDVRDGSDTVVKALLDESSLVAGCLLGIWAVLKLRS